MLYLRTIQIVVTKKEGKKVSTRIYNFSAGPAYLADEVIKTIAANLYDYNSSGLGMIEMSHRGPEFEALIGETESLLRRLLGIPEDYAVLFTTGGATNQFSMVPMNLLAPGTVGNYLLSGVWAEKALEEGRKFGETHIAGSTKDIGYKKVPDLVQLSPKASFLHYTSNNTVIGTQSHSEPNNKDEKGNAIPLICDASSDLLHKKIDVTKYGLIYAGAQKNIGTAGVTLIIANKELLASAAKSASKLPIMLDYSTYSKNASLYNTPPTFSIYVVCEVLRWIEKTGGLKAMEERNKEKASLLYAALDRLSHFYEPCVDVGSRSLMNVTFRIKDRSLEEQFLKKAEQLKLSGLRGHRFVGGIRASLYNAFPIAGVKALITHMEEFAGRF